MALNKLLSESPPSASRTVRRGSTAGSLWAVSRRLASVERELRVQFIRIAQLQAQVDLVLGALQRSSDGAHGRCAQKPMNLA